jgi:hypothetical protein
LERLWSEDVWPGLRPLDETEKAKKAKIAKRKGAAARARVQAEKNKPKKRSKQDAKHATVNKQGHPANSSHREVTSPGQGQQVVIKQEVDTRSGSKLGPEVRVKTEPRVTPKVQVKQEPDVKQEDL